MQQLDWFRAYVEKILEQAWDQQPLIRDADDDYPFRYGTAACFVHLEAGPPMSVRVVAQAVAKVKSSAKLLAELNDFNAAARSVTAYWEHGCVVVDTTVDADGANADTVTRACAEVGQAAHDMGMLLAVMFDGRTPFPAEDRDSKRTT
jgi:Putative bacterial sensory transduction regulator